ALSSFVAVHRQSSPVPSSLSLHDVLPTWATTSRYRHPVAARLHGGLAPAAGNPDNAQKPAGDIPRPAFSVCGTFRPVRPPPVPSDRKSTRLNSSHVKISYAVFCLQKKKTI